VEESRFNEALGPTAMRVRFDSATFAVGGWLQTYEALAHPTTAGIGDTRNEFGVVIGASVRARWPARPFLVGRYGWADPGDATAGASMMGNHLYDPGEKLGDLVLAAEQPVGRGKVIVFGDTSGMTNGLTMGCHRYTSRLLTYLAAQSDTPLDAWRQLVGLLAAAALVGLLIARPNFWAVAAAAIVMASTLAACTEASYRAWNVLPDRGRITPDDAITPDEEKTAESDTAPKDLAYIDASHAEAYSPESWRPDGVMGLAMTLVRNGYLTLMLPEFTRDRLLRPGATPERILNPDVQRDKLLRAGVLVSVAPGREFSKREREIVRDFVRAGGIFICTAGYEECGPVRALLSGTAPLAVPPEGKRQAVAGGCLLEDTDEYKRRYRDILESTRSEEVAEGEATRFAAQFYRVKDTDEYKQRYAEAVKEMRKAELATETARELARQRAKEYAARFAAQFAEPYGDEVGFGFHVGAPPSSGDQPPEPYPLGHFKSPFFEGGNYLAYVRFHAAWPVYCDDPSQLVVTSHTPGRPVIIIRRYGRGLAAVIGDTSFAMNKNLENEGGQPFEGKRENADFWRWFLALLGEKETWLPPRPENVPQPPDATEPESPLVLPPEVLPQAKSPPQPVAGESQPQRKP
ncbi:MAG TPA: hypothetical protein VM285_03690, partial [Polyangia bacterium]|nr:hypothetical protein [Polyangia bacterium]